MNWVVTITFWIFFLFIFKKMNWLQKEGIQFKWISLAFTIRVISGILYGYYDAYVLKGGDSMNYFRDANWIHQAIYTEPIAYLKMVFGIDDSLFFEKYYNYLVNWKTNDFDYFPNDARTIIRLNAVIRLFSFGYYNVHVIVFSFISFIGLSYLYKVFIKILDLNRSFIFAILFFTPSVILWGSALLKEPILLFGLGLFVYQLYKLTIEGFHLRNFILLFAAMTVILLVRFHVLVCILPGVIVYLWSGRQGKNMITKAAIVYSSFLIVALSFHHIVPGYNVAHIIYGKQMNFIKNEEFQKPGVAIEYMEIKPELTDIIMHSPAAFLKALIAPQKKIFTNPYRLVFFIEHILFWLFFYSVIRNFKTPDKKIFPFLFLCCSYFVIQYTLIGLTVPFEGAIIRLRSIAIPFLLFILLSFVDSKKVESSKSFLIF